MNIIKNKSSGLMRFKDLNPGDLFSFVFGTSTSEEVFLKITESPYIAVEGKVIQCVMLSTNSLCSQDNLEALVVLRDGELVLHS